MAYETLVHKLLDPWIIEKINEEERKKQEDKRPRIYIEEEPWPGREGDSSEKTSYIDPPKEKEGNGLYRVDLQKVF